MVQGSGSARLLNAAAIVCCVAAGVLLAITLLTDRQNKNSMWLPLGAVFLALAGSSLGYSARRQRGGDAG